MLIFKKFLYVVTILLLSSSCAKYLNDSDGEILPENISKDLRAAGEDVSVADQLESELIEWKNRRSSNKYTTLTLIFLVKNNVQASITKLQEAGGKLIYDPNQGKGSAIPFYIAELTPDQVLDKSLISSLGLRAASIDRDIKIVSNENEIKNETTFDPTDFIPTDSVEINELENRENLGEGVTIAILDTGVDASQPAFNNRVVYMYDATLSSRYKLNEISELKTDFEVEVQENPFEEPSRHKIILDQSIIKDAEKLYYAYIELERAEIQDDHVLSIVKVQGEKKSIYVDLNSDGQISSKLELQAKIDYNQTTKNNRIDGMIEFPSQNNIISYPVLLEEEDDELYLSLGETAGSHGTHVAGIAAANDPKRNLVGAAPKADIMSLRVCEGGCSYTSIIRGLYKAFYNGKVIPDVVNMSLGSHQQYKRDIFSYIFNDLSAKFGTIFFISASNNGPGFRSLNDFGNIGPMVMVGANASRKTLEVQYNLPAGAEIEDENLLFFSSLGPSYTGEMKPNIIAPGGAIASIEAAQGYMAHMNGTSMSSPLAAGAFAAILGELRKEDPDLFLKIDTIRRKNNDGTSDEKETLLPYVYGMRDSLQNSAKELKNLSRAQQGYGLIQVKQAKDLLKKYLSELNQSKRDYVEVVINNDEKTYDRSLGQNKVKKFDLSLGNDGERNKKSLAKFIAKGLDIELARVEVLSTTGELSVLDKDEMLDYFSIIEQGSEGLKTSTAHVPLNNMRKTGFFTYRNFNKMQDGKTYLAHYTVSSGGIKQTDILDVVHRGLDLYENGKDGMIEFKNIKIKHGALHRYPIRVTEDMNELLFHSNLVSSSGRIFVQVYDPNGEERIFDYGQKAPILSSKDALHPISTITDGKVLSGVWEITVSSVSSTWFSSGEYDLSIVGSKFGFHTNKISLDDKTTKVNLPFYHGSSKGDLNAIYSNVHEFDDYTLPVKAGSLSMHPFELPESYPGRIRVRVHDKYKDSYFGVLSKNLYTKTNGKYHVYTGAYEILGDLIVIGEPEPGIEKLYFAVDTFINFNFETFENPNSEIQIQILRPTKKKVNVKLDIKPLEGKDMSVVEITKLDDSTEKFMFNLIVGTGPYDDVQIPGEKTSQQFNTWNKSMINVVVE